MTLLILLLSITASAPTASDCEGTVTDLLDTLDMIEDYPSKTDTGKLVELLKCLYAPAARYVKEYDSFASEESLEKIRNETHQNRLKVIKLLIPLTRSDDWFLAQEAAAALAYYGYPPSQELLANYPDGPVKAILYSILGYERSYRWGIDRFIRVERQSKSDSPALAAKMTYLNLLYHLATPESIPFLNNLIASSQPQMIKARALLIKQRIIALHPEVK
jgi:hypothetical protein